MFVYFGVYFLLVMIGLLAKPRHEKTLLVLCMAFLVVFIGTRFYVGCDFATYLLRFSRVSDAFDFKAIFLENEAGFEFVNFAVAKLGLGFVWVNLICAVLVMVGYYHFLKDKYKPVMVLATMFPIVIIQLSMSGVRQAVAVAFVTASLAPFLKGNRLAVALWILAAASFHRSALIMFPLVFLAGRTIKLGKLFFAVVIGFPVAIVLLADRLSIYGDRYVDQIYGDLTSGGALLRYIWLSLPAVLYVLNRKKLSRMFPRENYVHLIFSLYILIIGTTAVVNTLILHRLSYYAFPISVTMLVLFSSALIARRQPFIRFMIPPAAYAIYMVGWFSMSRHATQCYSPYESYLFQ